MSSVCVICSLKPKPRCSVVNSPPAGRNAVDLFRGALELDPANTLAKAGLVRVADRLLSAAERALTAGNAEDATQMVDRRRIAHARHGARRVSHDADRDGARTRRADRAARRRCADKQERAHLSAAREHAAAQRRAHRAFEDNARFYLEAARQVVPDDPALAETSRALQKELLTRASAAATRAMPPKPSAGWRMPMAPARPARTWPPSAARCRTR